MPPHGVDIGFRVMLASAIYWVASALILIIFIDAILSFIPSVDRRNPIVMLIRSITEPIYRPLRRVIPPVRTGDAAWDLSPLIAFLGIRILAGILIRIII